MVAKSVALCVPAQGTFKLREMQQYVNDCTARHRNRRYVVSCHECVLDTPRAQSTDAVTNRAIECARHALVLNPAAEIGIGLERGNFIYCQGAVSMLLPIAAAAILYRETRTPKLIWVTPAEGKRDVMAELLSLCKQQGFEPHNNRSSFMDQALKELKSA